MKKKICFAFIIIAMFVGSLAAWAASVPPLVNYQGTLADANGVGVTGEKQMEFRLYDGDGTKIWGPQKFPRVPVVKGNFNVILGSADVDLKPISEAFFESDCFIGVKVGDLDVDMDSADVPEILPRQKLFSTPYAIHSLYALHPIGARDENLRIQYNESDMLNKVDISFDYMTLYEDSGIKFVKSVSGGSPLVVDIAATGPGGLDTGGELPNKWYFIWVIYNPQADDIKGLFSLSHESPAIPVDYTAKRLAGAIYNKSDNNFRLIKQIDNRVVTEMSEFPVTSSSTYQEIDGLDSAIPLTAKAIYGTSGGIHGYYQLFAPTLDVGNGLGYILTGNTNETHHWFPIPTLPIITPQTLYNRREYESYTHSSRYLGIGAWEY